MAASLQRGRYSISKILSIFLLLCIAFASRANAQTSKQDSNQKILLATEAGRYPIGHLVDYFEDQDGHISIEEIKAGKIEDLWRRSTWETPNFGFSRSTYWFRINIENGLPGNQEFLLELAYALHNQVEFYRVESGLITQSIQTGNSQAFHQRGFKHMNFVFPLSIKPGETASYYLKSRSSTSMQFPLIIWSVNKFAQEKTTEYGVLMLYYGIVIVMIFYNLFLSISIRRINYLYYVFYILSLGIFQSSLDGLAFQFLWPDYPTWASKCIPFFLGSTIFWLFRFSQTFLDTRTVFPRIHKVSQIFLGWSLLIMALSFFVPYSITIRLSASLTIFGLLFLAMLGVWSAKTGYRPSRFYVIAFFMFFTGGVLAAARMFGLLPSNFFTLYGSQLGSAIEIVLLSLALGDKIRFEQLANHRRIKALNSNLHDLNMQLEDKVLEKTRDIRAILDTIELGIFTINRQRKIDPDYSSFMHQLFGRRDLTGLNPADVLFGSSQDRTDALTRSESVIRMSLGEDEFNFQLNKIWLVRELMVKGSDNDLQKTVSIDWSPMIQNGIVEKILVSVKDISELVKIQDLEKSQREELIYISEIIKTSEAAFADFMKSCQETLLHLDGMLGQGESGMSSIVKPLRMGIHTLKGNAHFVGFKKMSEAIHHEEQYLQQFIDREEELVREHFVKVLANIWHKFHTYERINNEVLQRAAFREASALSQSRGTGQDPSETDMSLANPGPMSDAYPLHERKLFEQGLNVFRYLDFEKVEGAEKALTVEVLSKSFKTRYRRLDEYLRNLSLYTINLAKELGKAQALIKIDDSDVYINMEAQKILKNSFVHIFRNALDHGIENAEERLIKGKNVQGKVQINITIEQGILVIRCADDGRGVNLKRLRTLAAEQGRNDILGDPRQLAELIFSPGLTTSLVVSDISGRGIGMSAIRQYFEEHGGTADIELTEALEGLDFHAFVLKLTLPPHMFLADRQWLESIMQHAA